MLDPKGSNVENNISQDLNLAVAFAVNLNLTNAARLPLWPRNVPRAYVTPRRRLKPAVDELVHVI